MTNHPYIIDPPGYLTRFSRVVCFPGRLPHWEANGVAMFVTLRLRDSLPVEKRAEWKAELDQWQAEHRLPWTEEELREYKARFVVRVEKWLDAGYGSCLLGTPDARVIVEQALQNLAGLRYSLYASVVMPNHIHVLLMPCVGMSLKKIVLDFKRYTGRRLAEVKRWSGPLWEDEYWDTAIRSAEHFNRVRSYIKSNAPSLAFDAYAE